MPWSPEEFIEKARKCLHPKNPSAWSETVDLSGAYKQLSLADERYRMDSFVSMIL